MADVELMQLRQRRHWPDIVEGQSVPRVHFQPQCRAGFGGADQPGHFGGNLGLGHGMAVGAGVQFDHRRAEPGGGFELSGFGSDEQADPDAGVLQPADDRRQHIVLASGIEPAFGGAFRPAFGNDAGGVRAMLQGNAEHFIGCRHFEVERQADVADQRIEIGIGDVAPVLAQMGGDAIGPGLGSQQRGAHRIGVQPAARVADGGDMIDVDAKPQFMAAQRVEWRVHAARLPGLIAGMAASSGGSASAA